MNSLTKQLETHRGKVVWLASYPKSGNTWFRCFLSALFTGSVDINRINTDGIFSNRYLFDSISDIDGRLLDEDEVKLKMAKIFKFNIGLSTRLEFTKVHDAYSLDVKGQPIFPKEVSHRVFYIVRNPLDIAASFANHLGTNIDRSIKIMNNPNGYLAKQANGLNINNQFPQLMFDWSGHVNSWVNQKEIDVTIVRYEDLKKAPVKTFHHAMKSIELKVGKKRISEAVQIAKFDKLKSMEKKSGFKEKHVLTKSFFRKGQAGGWKNELNEAQIRSIVSSHKETMLRLGYTIPNL